MHALVALLIAAQPVASDAQLARIRQKMADHLARLPNYTCRQTIERSIRYKSSRRFQPTDTLRLEVAFVGGKELYSWPGGDKFDDKKIDEFAGGGAIGSGNFALHAFTLFRTKAPAFTFAGEESADVRKAMRYDFKVPRLAARYQIRTGANEAVVGYHGSFWVDAESLDLLRIEAEADEIPSELDVSRSRDLMIYGRTRIGDSDFLLPRSSELIMVDREGNESRNRVEFSACHQYMGQSVISFVEPASTAEPPKPILPLELSPDLQIVAAMNAEIRGQGIAIGDPISATVFNDVRKAGNVMIPKGALLKGRVTGVMHTVARDGDHYGLGIRFTTLEFDNRRAVFRGVLEEVRTAGRPTIQAGAPRDVEAREGGGVLLMRGHFTVPTGLLMVWRTLR